MGEWSIYGVSSGQVKAAVKKLEYNGEFMGERSLTCTLYSPTPIDLEVGDYITYRNEVFSIDYDPSVLKQSRRETYGQGFVYENVKFSSRQMELVHCKFLDYVMYDNQVHYSSLPTFSFYCESITNLTERIQANLNRLYTGGNAWTITVHTEDVSVGRINIDVDGATCWDALALIADKFKSTFVIRGRSIEVAPSTNVLEGMFQYGKGNGLRSIARTSDASQKIVTRLRAMGNTTNMPLNYYRNKNTLVYAPITEYLGPYYDPTLGADIHTTLQFNNCFLSRVNNQDNQYRCMVSLDKSLYIHAIFTANTGDIGFSVCTVGMYDDNTQAQVTQFLTQLASGTYTKLYFKSGVDKDKWPSAYKESTGVQVDTIGDTRLMLPSYPDETTDPYIDSTNIAKYGIREESVLFDGSNDLDDIYPTIEHMTADRAREAGATIVLDAGDNGNLDEIVSATQIDDDGIPPVQGEDKQMAETFTITIKDIGFNINEYLAADSATITMRDGKCEGREFEITQCVKSGNKYVLTCNRELDESLNRYFPYYGYNLSAGDKFVLLNIEMPDIYIDVAAIRLEEAAEAYLAQIDHTIFVVDPKIDNIKAKRHDDDVESSGTGTKIYDSIYEGMLMSIEDEDLDIDDAIFIDRLTIKEGESLIPQYEVVLRNEKVKSSIQQLQQQITDIRNGGITSVGSSGLNQLIQNYGDAHYLSKVKNDTAKGDITFEKNIHSNNFVSGFTGGSGWAVMMKNFLNAAGVNEKKSYAEFDNLTVRGTMRVFEFIVSQMLGENDNRIFTAMMEVDHYDPETGKVYLDTQDGKLYNPFRIDDVIVVQQYNPANVGSQGGNGYIVKSYELVITNVGVGSLSDRENRLDWVTFKNFRTEMDGVTPEDIITKNDTFVRIDNLSDPTRRGIAQMMTVGENTPYLDIIYGAKTEPDTKLKARLGNMEGVYNHLFGWLSGWGLYSLNAYLTGQFMLANTGFDTQNAFLITDNGLTSVYRQTRYNVPTNGNYLSNPSFLDDCHDWIADAAYQRTFVTGTDDLVMFNRNYYSDVYGFSGLGEHNGKQMLRLKHNNIIQKNNKIKPATQHREYSGSAIAPDTTGHMVYDMMYLTLRFFCVETGKVRIGFIDPESQGYSWIDDGYEPDGTPFEYPIGHWDERITKGPDVCTIEFSGKWDGRGDFVIDAEGEIYVDFVALTTEPLENLDAEYSTRIEQDAYHISLIAERVADNTTHISDLTITADAITSRVEVLEGDVLTQGSLITQTSNLISAQVGAINPQTGVFEYSAEFALAIEDGVSSATIRADQVQIDANDSFRVNDVLTVTNNEVNINGKLNGCDGTFTGELIVNDIDPTIDTDRGVVNVQDIHGNKSVNIGTTVARADIFGYIELYDHIGNFQAAKALLMPSIVSLNDYDHSESASLATDGLSISTPNYTFQVNSNGIRFVKNGVTYTWP